MCSWCRQIVSREAACSQPENVLVCEIEDISFLGDANTNHILPCRVARLRHWPGQDSAP